MALNFLGLGFSFGAKDMGLSKVQEKVTAGFGAISEGIEGVHSKADPVFSGINHGLDAVNGILATAEQRVASWADRWSQSAKKAEESTPGIADKWRSLTDTFSKGAEEISGKWDSTFGASFRAIGERVDTLKERFGGIITTLEPVTGKVRDTFKRAGGAVGGLWDKFTGLGRTVTGFAKDFRIGVVNTLTKGSFFFKKKGDDIRKTEDVIAEGFGKIKDVVGKMNDLLRVNKLAGFLQAISLGTLSKISDALGNLGSQGMNLTTGLEAQGVAAAKAAKATAVNMGLTGKEVQKVTAAASGMSIGLNISADSATQAIIGFKKASKELGAVGIKSAEDLAKFSEVTGVKADDLAYQMHRLSKQFGFTDKDINGLVGSFVKMGQETGDVSGALGQLPEIMDLMAEKSLAAGNALDPSQLASFAKQTAALGAAVGQLTGDADKARSVSMSLASSLVESQKGMAGLFAGTQEDVPQFIKELAVLSTAGDAFDLAAKGPAGLVEGLGRMAEQARASGQDMNAFVAFMGPRLEEMGIKGGAEIVKLATSTDKGVKEIMRSTSQATADLGKLAKEGFSTGRTLEEAFQMAKDAAVAHFRAGGKAGDQFLKDFVKNADAFNAKLDEMSKEGGPLGQFVDKLRDVHKLGMAGLLPKEMQGAGLLLSEIISQLKPLIGLIGGAILFFPGLTAVLGPIVTILGIFAINLFKARMAGQSWSDSMKTAFGETKKIILKAVEWIKTAFKVLLKEAPPLIHALWEEIKKAFNSVDWAAVGKTLLEGGKKVLGFLIAGFIKGSEKLNELLASIDWAGLVQSVGDALGKASSMLPEGGVVKLLESIAGIIIKRAGILANALITVVQKGLEMLAKVDISGGVATLFQKILEVAAGALEQLLPIIGGLLQRIPPLLATLLPIVLNILKELPGKLADVLKGLGPRLKEGVKNFIPMLLEGVKDLAVWLVKDAVPMIVKAIPAVVSGLWKLIGGIRSFLFDLVMGIIEGIRDWLVKKFPGIAKFIDPLIEGIKKTFEGIQKLWDWLGEIVTKSLKWITEAIVAAWEWLFGTGDSSIVTTFEAAWDYIVGAWEAFVAVPKAVIAFVYKIVKAGIDQQIAMWKAMWTFVKGVWDSIVKAAQDAWTAITDAWNGAVAWFENIWKQIKKTVTDVWDNIVLKVKTAWTDIKKVFENGKKEFADIWDKIWDGLTGEDSAFGKVKKGLQGVADSIKGIFTDAGDAIKKMFLAIASSIMETFKPVIRFFAEKVAWLQGLAVEAIALIPEAARKALGIGEIKVIDVDEVMEGLKTASVDMGATAGKGVEAGFENVMTAQSKTMFGFGGRSKPRTISDEDDGLLKKRKSTLQSEFFAAGGQVLTRDESTPVAQLRLPAEMKSLSEAIHNPDWWAGPSGMKEQMIGLRDATMQAAEMQRQVLLSGFDKLSGAVLNTRSSPAAGSSKKAGGSNVSQVTSLGAVNGEGMR